MPNTSLLAWSVACHRRFHEKLAGYGPAKSRYRFGVHSLYYEVEHLAKPVTCDALIEIMATLKGWTGWPPWLLIQNHHPIVPCGEDEKESWLFTERKEDEPAWGVFADPAHSDYWCVSSEGRLFTSRGYLEDSLGDMPRGKFLSLKTIIYRTGEALSHAQQMMQRIGSDRSSLRFGAHWEGLEGRVLNTWPDPWHQQVSSAAKDADRWTEIIASSDDMTENFNKVLLSLLEPLVRVFQQEVSEEFIKTTISEFRSQPIVLDEEWD